MKDLEVAYQLFRLTVLGKLDPNDREALLRDTFYSGAAAVFLVLVAGAKADEQGGVKYIDSVADELESQGFHVRAVVASKVDQKPRGSA